MGKSCRFEIFEITGRTSAGVFATFEIQDNGESNMVEQDLKNR